MQRQYKYGNVDYLGTKIKKALQRVHRGSITREEASAIIVDCGNKLKERTTVYEPDELLNFKDGYQ